MMEHPDTPVVQMDYWHQTTKLVVWWFFVFKQFKQAKCETSALCCFMFFDLLSKSIYFGVFTTILSPYILLFYALSLRFIKSHNILPSVLISRVNRVIISLHSLLRIIFSMKQQLYCFMVW